MDLNGYFDPVSLERPEFRFLPEEYSFSRNISIHTPDQPIRNLDGYQLALLGIPEDKNAFIRGSKPAPDSIRGLLYQLRKINNNVRVYDLGNLKITENINDTYFAIRDITLDLLERGIIPFLIGGSQDLGHGVLMALEKYKDYSHIVTIDPRLDFYPIINNEPNSSNYLQYIFEKEKKKKFLYTNIAHQLHFVPSEQTDIMENESFGSVRLGEIRNNIKSAEPLIRDADFLSIDLNAVKHSDAPGVTIPSPNGLLGDELCALSRYGGISDNVKAAGIFECKPDSDLNDQTSHLAAQSIWYFIDGLSHRIKENPVISKEHTKKFIVTMNELKYDIIFYKSRVSERWWMEIPVKNPDTNQNFFISCSYEDYQQACKNILPERWWKIFKRLDN